ncbi:MAG: DUF4401 domain-containing protein [Sediminibacterium sp.]|nr:DUF4401 domain-containing protein [Sediminibacterium sp.]
MSKMEQWQNWVTQIQQRAGEDLHMDEAAISNALNRMQERESSWIIKIVSVIGGILATQFFSGFLFISRIVTSGIGSLLFGCMLILGSIFIIRKTNQLVLDTMAVTTYLLAYVLVGVGLNKLQLTDNAGAGIMMLIALGTIFFIRHTVLAFFTFVIFWSGAVFLFYNNHLGNWSQCWPAVLGLVIVWMYWKEAAIIRFHPRCTDWYRPLLVTLVLFFVGFLQLLGKRDLVAGIGTYFSYTSLWLMGLLGWVLYRILPAFGMHTQTQKWTLLICLLLIILPTLRSPAIAGILLLLLLSFRSGDRWVWITSLLALAVFMIEFYYDLDYTLLTKSYILMGTGIGLLAFYYFTRKYWQSNEVE